MKNKYVDSNINRTKLKNNKSLVKGFNKRTFSSIFFLLRTYLMRQKLIAIFIILSLILFAIIVVQSLAAFDTDDYDFVFNIYEKIYLLMAIIPTMILTFFSIPTTLTRLHSSTMIKRIGATKTGEKAYILIVWIIYLIMSLILFFVLFIIETIFISSLGYTTTEWFLNGLYLILFIIMLVSISILIGIFPAGIGIKTLISALLFVHFVIFGGFIPPLLNMIQFLAPVTTTIFIIINPITFVSYVSSKLLMAGDENTITIMYGVICSIIISSSSLILSMALVSFNKIR